MTSVEARALAKLSAVYSPQRISFTTRQSAQLHCLKLKDLPQMLRDLAAAGMTTFHGCGDVTPQCGGLPLGLDLPPSAVGRPPHRTENGPRIICLPRTGQSAAEVQNHLFRLRGGMRAAGDQLRRRRCGASAAEQWERGDGLPRGPRMEQGRSGASMATGITEAVRRRQRTGNPHRG